MIAKRKRPLTSEIMRRAVVPVIKVTVIKVIKDFRGFKCPSNVTQDVTQMSLKVYVRASAKALNQYISLNQKTQILHDSHTQADSKHIEYFLLSYLCYDENGHKSNSLFGYKQ